MRQPTKSEVSTENAKLRRENDVLRLLLIDLFRGEAASQTQGDVTWLISRPGSASGGCAVIYTSWDSGDNLDVGAIDDLARQAQRARSYAYAVAPEEQERLAASGGLGGQAERIGRIGLAENSAPKLPSVLGAFHRARLR